MNDAFAVLAYIAVGFLVGWVAAHSTVAEECKKLGGFYVGNKTYSCSVAKGE